MSNLSQFAAGGDPQYWVSGTTYALGKTVRSPTDHQRYVRVVAGTGTTDPDNDPGNWRPDGARPIKSTQRGVIHLAPAVPAAEATIAAVEPGKTMLRFLGVSVDDAQGSWGLANIVLSNSTTITASRLQANGMHTNVSWELTEYY